MSPRTKSPKIRACHARQPFGGRGKAAPGTGTSALCIAGVNVSRDCICKSHHQVHRRHICRHKRTRYAPSTTKWGNTGTVLWLQSGHVWVPCEKREWVACKSIGTGDVLSGKSSGAWHVLCVISFIVPREGRLSSTDCLLKGSSLSQRLQKGLGNAAQNPASCPSFPVKVRITQRNDPLWLSIKPFLIRPRLSGSIIGFAAPDLRTDSLLISTGWETRADYSRPVEAPRATIA